MTTRPLDLAAKLRPAPRDNNWLFFVNVGLLGLFFAVFGSKFVLAPSLGVEFQLPAMAGANVDAQPATHHVSVTDSGQIFVRDGLYTLEQLRGWLPKQVEELRRAKNPREPVLLLQASRGVPAQVTSQIIGAARAAGFRVRWAVEEPKDAGDLPARVTR